MGQAVTTAHCCLENTSCLPECPLLPWLKHANTWVTVNSIFITLLFPLEPTDLAAHLWFCPQGPYTPTLLPASISTAGTATVETPKLPPTLEKKFGKTSDLLKTSI